MYVYIYIYIYIYIYSMETQRLVQKPRTTWLIFFQLLLLGSDYHHY